MTAEELSASKLKCTHCFKEFRYESERHRHELSHSPQFQCTICSKKFSFVSALRRHEKQHKRTNSVSCVKCGKHFRDEILLKRHLNYAHKGTFKCKKCKTTFKSDTALKTHVKTHTEEGERKYRCTFNGCEKTFNFPHHLKHHVMTHTDAKQYFCNVCDKGFIQLHHLKSHLKTHDPDSWLVCTVPKCNKKFPTEYARKRHLATHNKHFDGELMCKSNTSTKLKAEPEDVDDDKAKIQRDLISKDYRESNTEKIGLKKENSEGNENPTDLDGTYNNCKTVLGDCIVTTNSEDKDCLCAQMIPTFDESYDHTPITYGNDSPKLLKINTTPDFCIGCECASTCTVKNPIDCQKRDLLPNVEYGENGVVKLIDTIDEDIQLKVIVKDFDLDESDVPFNSCKAVLGKCIVSGNGTINENCLCAKMHVDETQVLAEEAQKLIPHPKDPDLIGFEIIYMDEIMMC